MFLDFCKNKESEVREIFERTVGYFLEKFDIIYGYKYLVCGGRMRYEYLVECYFYKRVNIK